MAWIKRQGGQPILSRIRRDTKRSHEKTKTKRQINESKGNIKLRRR
jgi:hypothetical protein